MGELAAITELVAISSALLAVVGFASSGVVGAIAYVIAGLLVFISATVAQMMIDAVLVSLRTVKSGK